MGSAAIRALIAAAFGALLILVLAPAANAYPAGPWGVEGPCAGLQPHECVYTPSLDGLSWTAHLIGYAQHYDKLGNYVCPTGPGVPTFYCDGLMLAVRALPPLPIGQWVGATPA